MALSATCVFASLDEVKGWLRLTPSDAQHDAILEDLANSVTEEIEAWTDRVFVTRSLTQTFDSRGVSRFSLRGYPVTSPLTTFTIDGTAIATDEYTLDVAKGVITLLTGPYGSRTGTADVVLTYTAGYARVSLPARVVQLARAMVAHRYQDWSAGANSAQQVQFGGQSYTPQSSWTYYIKDTLDILRDEVRGVTVA